VRALLLSAAAVALGFAPSASQAAIFRASDEDGRDHRDSAARDVKRVTSTFDSEAGRWTARVVFYGRVRPSDDAYLRISLQDDPFGACHEQGVPLAWFTAWTSAAR